MSIPQTAAFRVGLMAALLLLLTGVGVVMPVTPTFALPVTLVDDNGPDDEPGQKDLNQLTTDEAGLPTSLTVTWNWDDTSISGANTLDGCALFDTDSDGKANYSLCVTAGGSPVAYQSTTLYSCNDSNSDRCSANVLIGTFSSSCTAAVATNSDPFASDPAHDDNNDCDTDPACFDDDTVASCTVQLSDFGSADAFLVNVCSYPSQQPNSDPSDCVATPGSGFLTIEKDAGEDTQTTFTFELGAGQTSQSGDNTWSVSGTDSVDLIPFAPGTTYDLSEVVPTGWDLTSASCEINGISTGTGTPPNLLGVSDFTIQSGLETVCTFTNSPPECDEDADCNDNNVCTDDTCNVGAGECVYTNDDTNSCSDGDACNGSESCSAGTCQAGMTPNCDDNNACTDDSCDAQQGCVYTPDDTNDCSDGNACNGSESCSAGTCQAGTALTCNDENACTDDSCNPASGCVYTPDNTNDCSDGNACNGSESCSAGTCQPGTAPNCNDSNPCTSDFCDQSLGCMNDPTPLNGQECNDGNSQTINDRCQNGICEGDLPPASVCGNGVIEAGETCDDANLLNGDGCSSTCQDECVTPATDCQLTDQQCEVAVCVATTGDGARCKVNNRPNGTVCNDGSAETSPDQCSQGDCVGGFAYPTCAPASCGPAACGTPTIVGTSSSETLNGTIGNDSVAGNGGNDTVKLMEGDDCSITGSGKDRVEGQKGNDKIVDAGGSNTLNGGEGNDCIFGGSSTDTILGEDGCDVISGSGGADTIEGRRGNDVIDGGASNDKIFGHEGNDVIYGGEGDDTIDGGAEGGDIDSCDGGPGTDICKNCEVTINCESIK